MTKKILTQIYEIQTSSEAEVMVDLGVDHIGSVIVSAADWKQPPIKETINIIRHTSAKSSLILLYHDRDLVFSSLDYYQPDIVHFCETLIDPHSRRFMENKVRIGADLQQLIRERFPEIQIMRSIPIPESGKANGFEVTDLAKRFETISDFFLTDTLIVSEGTGLDQPVCGFVGITGKICDWKTAAQLVKESPIPVILAGGLSPDNVYESIKEVGPAGVDSCTLTNAVDGMGRPIRFQKDAEKVRRFLAQTHRAQQNFD